jgi:hypothetical protein
VAVVGRHSLAVKLANDFWDSSAELPMVVTRQDNQVWKDATGRPRTEIV